MRLIDADAIRYIDLNADMPQSKVRVWVSFKEWIDAMPTIEERKNVRGEWKEVAERGLCDLRRCSNCGHIEPVGLEMITPKPNFCPNCGAEMKGEKDE